jgi:hypothetical protein
VSQGFKEEPPSAQPITYTSSVSIFSICKASSSIADVMMGYLKGTLDSDCLGRYRRNRAIIAQYYPFSHRAPACDAYSPVKDENLVKRRRPSVMISKLSIGPTILPRLPYRPMQVSMMKRGARRRYLGMRYTCS